MMNLEGCIAMDNNGICDLAYVIPGGSGIDHYPMVHWIYDIPVRNHVLSTENLQQIIVLWLG